MRQNRLNVWTILILYSDSRSHELILLKGVIDFQKVDNLKSFNKGFSIVGHFEFSETGVTNLVIQGDAS